MSGHSPYQVANAGRAIAGFWLIQTIGLLLFVIVAGEVFFGGGGSLFCVVPATILSMITMAMQALFVCDANKLGGTRAIGVVRRWISSLTFGVCVMIAGAIPMWLFLILLLSRLVGNGALAVFGLGCGGMIVMLVLGTVWIEMQARAAPRESRYRDAARRLGIWSIACFGVCVLFAFFAAAAAPDSGTFQFVMLLTSPPIVSVGLVALGCYLYLKELAIAREPWYQSHCAECGYDLSGNLTVTQCSECGSAWKGGLEVIRGA
ncbi:MAG: hypothetical protein KIT19_04035 [Phycisphaeraceae bacterium]|nr:hypothetical protein [Phycisphaeraceae bacterium]